MHLLRRKRINRNILSAIKFNYLKFMELYLPVNMYHTIAKLYEYKVKQELYVENYPDILKKIKDNRMSFKRITGE